MQMLRLRTDALQSLKRIRVCSQLMKKWDQIKFNPHLIFGLIHCDDANYCCLSNCLAPSLLLCCWCVWFVFLTLDMSLRMRIFYRIVLIELCCFTFFAGCYSTWRFICIRRECLEWCARISLRVAATNILGRKICHWQKNGSNRNLCANEFFIWLLFGWEHHVLFCFFLLWPWLNSQSILCNELGPNDAITRTMAKARRVACNYFSKKK